MVLLWLLIILLGFLLLVFLLSLIPVKAFVKYSEDKRECKVKYLFFTFDLNKQKKKKETKELAKEEPVSKEKNANVFKDFDTIKLLIGKASDSVKKLLRHLHIDHFDFFMSVGTDDPAKTGILYGQLCAYIYSATAFLDRWFLIQYDRVEILPNFHQDKFEVDFSCTIALRPIIALAIGANIGYTLLREKWKKKRVEKKRKQQQI